MIWLSAELLAAVRAFVHTHCVSAVLVVRRRVYPVAAAAVLVSLLAVLAFVQPASSATRDWSGNDFRLQTVTASMGVPEQSSLVLEGTLSQRAYDAFLRPNVRFTLEVAVTCAPASDPTSTTTATLDIDSQIAQYAQPGAFVYTHTNGGNIRWTSTWSFPAVPHDDFDAFLWCSSLGTGPMVLSDLTLVGLHGITWLAVPGTSPTPGTSYYSYQVGPGSTVLRFQPPDGTPAGG
jgi:hypothetical protein